jgi:cytoskeletal protein RodZ
MENQLLQSDYSNEKPHFDEEWTLLTARPVVPLDEVRATRSKRRNIRLVALFAGALILGALSALVVISFERSRMLASNPTESVIEQNDVTQSSALPESSAASTENKIQEPAVPTETVAANAPKTLAVVREKTKTPERHVADNSPAPAKSASKDQPVKIDSDSKQQPRAQLFDEWPGRWEERRARRVRRQERRERAGRRGRDLHRIDEIFEGPRP